MSVLLLTLNVTKIANIREGNKANTSYLPSKSSYSEASSLTDTKRIVRNEKPEKTNF